LGCFLNPPFCQQNQA